MFSTAIRTSVRVCSSATESTNVAAADRCQTNGGWTTTVLAPTSSASSIDRASLTSGSVDQTRAVINRQGECTDRTGIWCRSIRCRRASALRLAASVITMTSTPSYPRSAASENAAAAGSGKADAVDSTTGISGTRTGPLPSGEDGSWVMPKRYRQASSL